MLETSISHFYSRLKVQKLRDQSEVSVRSGYGVGTHWVRSYTAWDINGAYAHCTECVQSEYRVQGGWGMTILVQIDVELIFKGVFL